MKKVKPHLPLDLMIINTLDHNIGLKTLQYCRNFFDFNETILISDRKVNYENFKSVKIDRFKNLNEYSDFCLKLIDYSNSNHLLLVQDDGHILNPSLWDPEFLNYDYIGAPWPSSKKWIKRFDKYGESIYKSAKENIRENRVGNGGFSLRSAKFLEYSAKFDSCDGIAEDIFLCLINYTEALNFGIKFPSFDTALKFSTESGLKGYKKRRESHGKKVNINNHFGWHGKRFVNSEDLMNLKFS
tara:strand:+ start:13842 stop:14567 length:726 start_codon:yes stop_codon:yes gene_type:complete